MPGSVIRDRGDELARCTTRPGRPALSAAPRWSSDSRYRQADVVVQRDAEAGGAERAVLRNTLGRAPGCSGKVVEPRRPPRSSGRPPWARKPASAPPWTNSSCGTIPGRVPTPRGEGRPNPRAPPTNVSTTRAEQLVVRGEVRPSHRGSPYPACAPRAPAPRPAQPLRGGAPAPLTWLGGGGSRPYRGTHRRWAAIFERVVAVVDHHAERLEDPVRLGVGQPVHTRSSERRRSRGGSWRRDHVRRAVGGCR